MKKRLDRVRIADGTREGRASFRREYAIGHHPCSACGAETPDPPQSFLDDLCAAGYTGTTIWPGHHGARDGHWIPAGWVMLDGDWLCDDCSRAVNAFLSRRAGAQVREGEVHPDHLVGNHVLLRGNVATALELAENALLAGKPPIPTLDPTTPRFETYRWRLPGDANHSFQSSEDAKLYWFRYRIREIIAALTGKNVE